MTAALQRLGPVTRVDLPVNSNATQRLSVMVRLWRRTRQELTSAPDLVVIEISGRALAELATAACTLRRGSTVWLVVHDPPALAGPLFMIELLDRRGLRRLAMALSNTVGAALERWIVARTDVLIALSVDGEAALAERFPGARTAAVPLPTESPPPSPKSPVLFFPGYMGTEETARVLKQLDGLVLRPDLRIRVGAVVGGNEGVRMELESTAVGPIVELTGYLDDAELDAAFADAKVVVRARQSGTQSGNSAAASGPITTALAAGCVVLALDSRGSRRCLEAAGMPGPRTDIAVQGAELVDLPDGAFEELSARARDHVRRHHSPTAVGQRFASIWTDTR